MKFLNYIKKLFKKPVSRDLVPEEISPQKDTVVEPPETTKAAPKPQLPEEELEKVITPPKPVKEIIASKKKLPELRPAAKTEAAQKKPLAITIGLDFGTSTTKCIVNLEGYEDRKDKFMAISFPHNDINEGSLCIPTAIGISGDSLIFGHEADAFPEESVIRSFKMAIPCMKNDWGNYKSSYMILDKPGYFRILDQGINAAGLSILYLAWVIKQIKTSVLKYLDENREPTFFLNMAAPLDHLLENFDGTKQDRGKFRNDKQNENLKRDTRVSKYYRAIYQWSLKLSDQSHNPWRLHDAVAELKKLHKSKLLSLEETPAYVIPETIAAITTYIKRPRTRSGRFATVDIGAGSTDISYYWLEKHDGTIKPWYYSSGSLHIGIDDIDRYLEDILNEEPGNSLRQKREHLQEKDDGLYKHREVLKPILDEFDNHKKKMFFLAYQKEKRQADWGTPKEAFITLLLLGGGCKIDVIYKLSHNKLWDNVIGSPDWDILGIDLTNTVLMPDGSEELISEVESFSKQIDLLVIAEGLANKIIDIPEYGVQMNRKKYFLKVLEYDLFSGERKYVEKVME